MTADVGVDVAVGVGIVVTVDVGVGVTVGMGIGVTVDVGVGVAVGMGIGVTVGVSVGVAIGVGIAACVDVRAGIDDAVGTSAWVLIIGVDTALAVGSDVRFGSNRAHDISSIHRPTMRSPTDHLNMTPIITIDMRSLQR